MNAPNDPPPPPMPDEPRCPQCGAPLGAGALAGLCPACLLREGVAGDSVTGDPRAAFEPPSAEELAALFPQLEILEFIGKGGMGAVYKARQKELDRIVALKILPPAMGETPGFAERFALEAKALAKLSHPGIVTIHDFGRANGLFYFVMEYVDGMNLRQLMAGGRVSPREALAIVPAICDALQFAHDHGIVHRDIKPANVLIDRRGRVKVADFGLAKLMEAGTEAAGSEGASGAADPSLTEPGKVMGTPSYMAPEQRSHPEEVDHRADIYALGVVFYELLTGELPGPRLQPPSRKVQVDVRLDEIVLRALEREPQLRYQQASQVKSDVETLNREADRPTQVDADRLTQDALARDYAPPIMGCLRRGWALVKSDFWPLVGMTALSVALLGMAGSLGDWFGRPSGEPHHSSSMSGVLYLLVMGPLVGGLQLYFLHKIRGRRATVETAFSGFTQRYLHLFLAGFVTTTLTTLGYFCFILPGIYLTIAWTFSLALVIDQKLDFWTAMELSRKTISKHWWKFFGFALVLTAFKIAGLLVFIVGFFLALPIAIAALMIAYEDLFGLPDGSMPAAQASTATSATPIPRWGWIGLGVALLAALVMFFNVRCQYQASQKQAHRMASLNHQQRSGLPTSHQWLLGEWAFDAERTKIASAVAAATATDHTEKSILKALSTADFSASAGMTWIITPHEMQSNHPQSGRRVGPYRVTKWRDADSVEIETSDEGKWRRMLFKREGDWLRISNVKREGPVDLPAYYKRVEAVERSR